MIKLILTFAIVIGVCAIIKFLFGIGWPFYIISGIALFVWLSINNDFFNRIEGN